MTRSVSHPAINSVCVWCSSQVLTAIDNVMRELNEAQKEYEVEHPQQLFPVPLFDSDFR